VGTLNWDPTGIGIQSQVGTARVPQGLGFGEVQMGEPPGPPWEMSLRPGSLGLGISSGGQQSWNSEPKATVVPVLSVGRGHRGLPSLCGPLCDPLWTDGTSPPNRPEAGCGWAGGGCHRHHSGCLDLTADCVGLASPPPPAFASLFLVLSPLSPWQAHGALPRQA
jgi:hypothetical protein